MCVYAGKLVYTATCPPDLPNMSLDLKRDDDSYCDVVPVERDRIEMISNTAYQTAQDFSDEHTYEYITDC